MNVIAAHLGCTANVNVFVFGVVVTCIVRHSIKCHDICCIIAGTVVEEWMPVDVTRELYHIDYKPSDHNHPKVVVERARSRLNECRQVAVS